MAKEQVDSKALRRVSQACARCKIKKVKCCGSMPCSRCRNDDALCFYGVRGANDKRLVSKTHVDRLHWQQKILMKALKALWKKHQQSSQEVSSGSEEPSIHAIVAGTGVLDEESMQPFSDFWETRFDEDLLSSTSSPRVQQDDLFDSPQHQGASHDETNWSPTDVVDSDHPLPDADHPVTSRGDALDFTPVPNLSDDAFGEHTLISEVPVPPSLAERRGAIWLPKCQMPPYKPESLLPGLDALLTEPHDDDA